MATNASHDATSAPPVPQRARTAWSEGPSVSRTSRPLGAGEIRVGNWQDVASLDAVEPGTEETPPTAVPGTFRFDFAFDDDSDEVLAAVIDDSTGLEALDGPTRARIAEAVAITLNDAEDEAPRIAAPAAEPVTQVAPAPAGEARAEAGTSVGLVLGAAIATAAVVVGLVWALGLI